MKKLALAAVMVILSVTIFGQSIQKGTLLGLHTGQTVLKPDITMDQYLSFVKEKLIPGYEKNFPGMKVYILKGIRGESVNNISFLMVFSSEEVRNKYFKSEGGFSEAGAAAGKNMDAIYAEGDKFVKDTNDDKYTDWLVQ